MSRNIQRYGLINVFTLLFVGGVAFAIAHYCNSLSGQVSTLFLGVAFLVAVVSWFQMRLEEREALEKLEFDELTRGKGKSALFERPDAETFAAQRSREQFERFFVPIFTVLLFIGQALGAWWIWRLLKFETAFNHSVVMSMFAVFALWLFLLGRYSTSIARLEGHRLLRPGAAWLLLNAYLAFVVLVVGIGLTELGVPKADLYLARALVILFGLIAIETLINLVLEIYRPRIRGKPGRPVYESRLVGLLGQPEGLITTAAQALDYQFGFKVSETWFYRFIERTLGWLILCQVVILLLSTCFFVLEPGEKALLERFGTRVESRPVLGPGLHVKFPWPIDRVYRFPMSEIQSFNIGFQPDTNRPPEKTILWTVPHYKEENNFLVASHDTLIDTNQPNASQTVPVSLLTVGIPVQYEITNIIEYAYNHANAKKLLEDLATREVVRYLVGVDLKEIMSTQRLEAGLELRERIQARADELNLGVNVLMVGLEGIHPPTKVAEAFERVVSAEQEKQAIILKAEGDAARIVPGARAQALRDVNEAEAEKTRIVTTAVSLSGQFTNQMVAFKAAPSVYPWRLYYEALTKGAASARKYIVTATNTQDVIQLDLQDKFRPDLESGIEVPD